jgi:hypothetical protein
LSDFNLLVSSLPANSARFSTCWFLNLSQLASFTTCWLLNLLKFVQASDRQHSELAAHGAGRQMLDLNTLCAYIFALHGLHIQVKLLFMVLILIIKHYRTTSFFRTQSAGITTVDTAVRIHWSFGFLNGIIYRAD